MNEVDSHSTFQAQPMIFYSGFGVTVVAVHKCLRILELWWHRLTFYTALKMAKCHLHIHYASAAYRTFI